MKADYLLPMEQALALMQDYLEKPIHTVGNFQTLIRTPRRNPKTVALHEITALELYCALYEGGKAKSALLSKAVFTVIAQQNSLRAVLEQCYLTNSLSLFSYLLKAADLEQDQTSHMVASLAEKLPLLEPIAEETEMRTRNASHSPIPYIVAISEAIPRSKNYPSLKVFMCALQADEKDFLEKLRLFFKKQLQHYDKTTKLAVLCTLFQGILMRGEAPFFNMLRQLSNEQEWPLERVVYKFWIEQKVLSSKAFAHLIGRSIAPEALKIMLRQAMTTATAFPQCRQDMSNQMPYFLHRLMLGALHAGNYKLFSRNNEISESIYWKQAFAKYDNFAKEIHSLPLHDFLYFVTKAPWNATLTQEKIEQYVEAVNNNYSESDKNKALALPELIAVPELMSLTLPSMFRYAQKLNPLARVCKGGAKKMLERMCAPKTLPLEITNLILSYLAPFVLPFEQNKVYELVKTLPPARTRWGSISVEELTHCEQYYTFIMKVRATFPPLSSNDRLMVNPSPVQSSPPKLSLLEGRNRVQNGREM